ncbi:MAG: hypothetical protein Q9159_000374 [Coniocarpon cinnabarinum]
MHVQPHQVRQLANASENELVAEFSAMRAAQDAKHPHMAANGRSAPSRCSYMALTQSVPTSFQVTARSSMHAPEPVSPRSDQGVHYKGSKGSFSIPFRDGRSPRLHQQPSIDSQKPMTVSEDTIMEDAATQVPTPPVIAPAQTSSNTQPIPTKSPSQRPNNPRAGNLCAQCHSKVIEPDEILSELEGSPVDEKPLQDIGFVAQSNPMQASSLDHESPTGAHDEDHQFKELSPEPRCRPQFAELRPQAQPKPFLRLLDQDEVRVSMNRSSINGGLFSSWAAASESSDDDNPSPAPGTQQQGPSPQQRIANRLKQRGTKATKAQPKYRAPPTPPPVLPLPSVPLNQPPLNKPKPSGYPRHASREKLKDFAVIEEEEETVPEEVPDAPAIAPVIGRRPSIKNVRFKSDESLIEGEVQEQVHRVQESLDDLQENLSRLEVDLSRRPSHSKHKRTPSGSSKHSHKSSDSSQGSSTRHRSTRTYSPSSHRRRRTNSSSGNKPQAFPERRSSRGAALANQYARSKAIGSQLGSPPAISPKVRGPLPPLPSPANPPPVGKDERHYSTGSATIPASIAVQ